MQWSWGQRVKGQGHSVLPVCVCGLISVLASCECVIVRWWSVMISCYSDGLWESSVIQHSVPRRHIQICGDTVIVLWCPAALLSQWPAAVTSRHCVISSAVSKCLRELLSGRHHCHSRHIIHPTRTWHCLTYAVNFLWELRCYSALSALTLLVGRREGHLVCKNWVMKCWCGYVSGVRCKWFAYGLANAMPPPSHHLLLY